MTVEQEISTLQQTVPSVADAENVLRTFIRQYLTDRNIEATMKLVAENVQGIGISSDKSIESKKEFSSIILEEKRYYPEPIPFQLNAVHINAIGENIFQYVCQMSVDIPNQLESRVRFSGNLKWENKTWSIIMFHVSRVNVPCDKEKSIPGIFFHENLNFQDQYDLVRMMCQMMPGGILGIEDASDFPIYAVNDRLLEMLEYTYDELEAAGQGLLVPLIYAEDQEYVVQKLEEAFAKNNSFEAEYRLKKRNGGYLWVYNIGHITSLHHSRKTIISTVMDITHSIEMRKRLRAESERDALTKLYNRKGGEERVQKELECSEPYAFLILDIDNFKKMNDCYGHYHGDQALCFLAQLLVKNFRKSDVIYRIGGDEFGIFLGECKEYKIIQKKLEQVCASFRKWGKRQYPDSGISLSIGGIMGKDAADYVTLYQQADKLLYQVKNEGKGNVFIQPHLEE